MTTRLHGAKIGVLVALLCAALVPRSAAGHCDGLDGPVVEAARRALESQNVDLVLVWVQEPDEKEVRDAFQRTLAVRKLGHEAMELADRSFFETLVRLHRRGEGAPYTGLVPAGRDLGPAIPLADQALASGKIDRIAELIVDETRTGLVERFQRAKQARDYAPSDVEAGRDYVAAYVTYIHYVERAHEAAVEPVAGHFAEPVHAAEPHAERTR